MAASARLVRQQLRVAPERICTVPMYQPIMVEGVRITFVDANHCPGAAMILFEPPGASPVVHTGDCRQGGILGARQCPQPAGLLPIGRVCRL